MTPPDLHQIDAVAMIVARARKRRLRSVPAPDAHDHALPSKGADVVRLPRGGRSAPSVSRERGGGTPKGAA